MILDSGRSIADALRTELKPGDRFRLWGSVQGARIRTLKGGEYGEQRALAGSWLIVQGDGERREHSLLMRAVLSRETDVGHQVVAGELLDAIALEAEVTIEGSSNEAPTSPWAAAATQSARSSEPRLPEPNKTALPHKPVRAQQADADASYPDAGDLVEHFAFGPCEVVKSDGERLHLRVQKDGRIREIALEMLRATRLSSDGTRSTFKLERK
jgi:hypothetical protein